MVVLWLLVPLFPLVLVISILGWPSWKERFRQWSVRRCLRGMAKRFAARFPTDCFVCEFYRCVYPLEAVYPHDCPPKTLPWRLPRSPGWYAWVLFGEFWWRAV